jgi:prophage maintenance system killer protein
MDVTKNEIVGINKALGGSLRSDASIDFALSAGNGRSVYWRIALLLRAILVDHPFTDVNKRTALVVALLMLKRNKIKLGEEEKLRLDRQIAVISKSNMTSLRNIERRVRYAVEGD